MDPSSQAWQSLDTVTSSETEGLEMAELRIPGLTILAHGDVGRVGECSGLPALSSGRVVELSRLTPGFCAPGEPAVLRPLAEPHLSRNPLHLAPDADGGILIRTAGSRTRIQVDGVEVYDQRRLSAEHIARGVVLLLAERVALVLHYLDPAPPNDVPRFGLVGDSMGLLQVRQSMARVADLDVPVLIRGETGTGKELVARGVHQASGRRQGPLVAVNMGALPASLAAAELFGASKGAFTGAHRQRKGFFSRAQGGSLFLDEIGETPFEVQGMLLRTLETSEVLPVGSENPQSVDARILAATDAALETAIEEGRFRAPLLHRLSGYEVWLPPLRQRRDDIGRLLIYFLRQELAVLEETWRLESGVKQAWLPASLVARLAVYDWPGNVRQLRNVARQLVIAHRGARRLALTPRIEQLMEEGQQNLDPEPLRPTPTRLSAPPKTRPRDPIHDDTPQSAESLIYDRPMLRTLVYVGVLPNTSADVPPTHEQHSQLDRSARRLLADFDGYEIEKTTGFLLLFSRPLDAVGYALELREVCQELARDHGVGLPLGVAIQLGEVILRRNPAADVARGARPFEIEGQARNLVEQIWPLARGGRLLITRAAFELTKQSLHQEDPAAAQDLRCHSHGIFHLAAAADGLEILALGHSDSDGDSLPDIESPLDMEGDRGSSLRDSADLPKEESRPRYRQPDDVSEEELLAALRAHAFKLQPAAAALRLSRTSLYALIEKSSRIRKAKDLTLEDIEASQQRCDGNMDAMAADLEVSRKGLRRRMTQLGMP